MSIDSVNILSKKTFSSLVLSFVLLSASCLKSEVKGTLGKGLGQDASSSSSSTSNTAQPSPGSAAKGALGLVSNIKVTYPSPKMARISWSAGPNADCYLVRLKKTQATDKILEENCKGSALQVEKEVESGQAYSFWIHSAYSNFNYGDSKSFMSSHASFSFTVPGSSSTTSTGSASTSSSGAVTGPVPIPKPTTPEQSTCINNSAEFLTQHGITWTFDKAYPCGQFVNGDYWVKGPITLKSIHPFPESGFNGFDINPRGFSVHGFTYDSRIQGYSAAGAPQNLPRVVPASSSIVSTVSAHNPDRVGPAMYGSQQFYNTPFGNESRSSVRTAAVLTVLADIPLNKGATYFRPPYAGTDKPLYSASNLKTEKLLSLAPVANTPSIESVLRKFSRVQLDHNSSYLGAYMHPVENMNNYGASLTNDIGSAILRLSLNDRLEDKMPLLVGVVQAGIDQYAMLKSGTYWTGDGGHFSGRKIKILFSGLMLNDAGMLGIGKSHSSFTFAEDCQTFYTTENPPAGFYSKLDPKYGPNYARYQIKHCAPADYHIAWSQDRIGEELGDGSTYFAVNYPSWIGQTLAAQLYGLKDEWNHNAYFDLVNRSVETLGFSFGVYRDWFNNNMWQAYRSRAN